jgi:uncharacterized protein YkwD
VFTVLEILRNGVYHVLQMRLRLLFCLLSLAVYTGAAASDLYEAINRLRGGQGDCAAAERLPPLRSQATLERAARGLSQGADLQQSLKEAGYRATRARVLSFTGQGVDAKAAGILARPAYCQQLLDAAMTEVGVYVDARQVWIVLAAPFAPAVAMSAQAAGQRVLDLVNQARAAARNCGERPFKAAPPLRWNDTLAEASRLHAEDMARHNYFSHAGRDGTNPAQRVARAGYRYRTTGENIAAGPQTPDDAVAGWIRSPGHCANVMNPAYSEMGAAFAVDAQSKMGVYWAQVFGTPR